jgi:ankyrin repeat protein
VNHDDIDLDIQNTLEGDTPLHVAVQYANQDHEMAVAMVELLLAGGADPK